MIQNNIKRHSVNTDKTVYFDHVITLDNSQNVTDVFDHLAKNAAKIIGQELGLIARHINTPQMHDTAAVGDGVAIPHMSIRGLRAPVTILAKLKNPIPLSGSPDMKAVDLMCLVLSPKRLGSIHLMRLSRITRRLRKAAITQLMRNTDDSDALLSMLNNPDGWIMAA